MKLKKTTASLLSLLIGLIAIFFIYLLAPKPSYSAQGIFLPSQTTLSPYQGSVQVLTNYPIHYKILGFVHIEHHKITNELAAENQIFDLAKSMTGTHGGNAIVVQNFGATSPPDNETSLASYIFNGAAIYEY